MLCPKHHERTAVATFPCGSAHRKWVPVELAAPCRWGGAFGRAKAAWRLSAPATQGSLVPLTGFPTIISPPMMNHTSMAVASMVHACLHGLGTLRLGSGSLGPSPSLHECADGAVRGDLLSAVQRAGWHCLDSTRLQMVRDLVSSRFGVGLVHGASCVGLNPHPPPRRGALSARKVKRCSSRTTNSHSMGPSRVHRVHRT